jgi:hypothetical protein
MTLALTIITTLPGRRSAGGARVLIILHLFMVSVPLHAPGIPPVLGT